MERLSFLFDSKAFFASPHVFVVIYVLVAK